MYVKILFFVGFGGFYGLFCPLLFVKSVFCEEFDVLGWRFLLLPHGVDLSPSSDIWALSGLVCRNIFWKILDFLWNFKLWCSKRLMIEQKVLSYHSASVKSRASGRIFLQGRQKNLHRAVAPLDFPLVLWWSSNKKCKAQAFHFQLSKS